MTNEELTELTELRAIADSLRKQLEDAGGPRVSLDELIGESYAKELAGMTEAEAVQHLRSLDGLKLRRAYLFFSRRADNSQWANHPMLAEVCLKYMASSDILERMTGAGDIGIWLEGSHDKQASQALALMIRNTEETDEIRRSAYSSLQLINNKASPLDCLRRNIGVTNAQHGLLQEVDWMFVNSFL